jgi:hypothetical protein
MKLENFISAFMALVFGATSSLKNSNGGQTAMYPSKILLKVILKIILRLLQQ